MLRFAIVEDDPLFQNELTDFLSRYRKESGLSLEWQVFSNGMDLVERYSPVFDIILMDVEMPLMDGMSTAKKIRETDPDTIIIFITNMSQYAIEGYSVNALDYVLKPLSYYAFSQCLQRAITRLNRNQNRYILISNQQGARRISAFDLLFVEVHGHTLIYHTKEADFSVTGSMKDVEESLAGLPFFRCNKCDLVNLSQVDGVRNGDAVVGPYTVQVSRAKKKAFMTALNQHLNGVGS